MNQPVKCEIYWLVESNHPDHSVTGIPDPRCLLALKVGHAHWQIMTSLMFILLRCKLKPVNFERDLDWLSSNLETDSHD